MYNSFCIHFGKTFTWMESSFDLELTNHAFYYTKMSKKFWVGGQNALPESIWTSWNDCAPRIRTLRDRISRGMTVVNLRVIMSFIKNVYLQGTIWVQVLFKAGSWYSRYGSMNIFQIIPNFIFIPITFWNCNT